MMVIRLECHSCKKILGYCEHHNIPISLFWCDPCWKKEKEKRDNRCASGRHVWDYSQAGVKVCTNCKKIEGRIGFGQPGDCRTDYCGTDDACLDCPNPNARWK